jgi:hypothetical protein
LIHVDTNIKTNVKLIACFNPIWLRMVPYVKANPIQKTYAESQSDVAAVAGKARTQLFIGGRWLNAKNALAFDVVDPSTARVIATLADGEVADAIAAVDAAAAAAEPCKEAADQVVSCSMELGGNAPFAVFDDVMVGIAKAAVDGVLEDLDAQGAVAG